MAGQIKILIGGVSAVRELADGTLLAARLVGWTKVFFRGLDQLLLK